MTSRTYANEIATTLARRRHNNACTGAAWTPGFRATQASPRTVRLWHDGPDEQQHLDAYAEALRAVGYTVTPEPGTTCRRPALRITHP